MLVQTALEAIEKWYDGEHFEIDKITTEPKGDVGDFEQSKTFLSVVGWQESGHLGDDFHGAVYFEFEPGKFISTRFWC